MKRFLVLVIGAFLCVGLAARAGVISGISVVVNSDVITYGEVVVAVERSMMEVARLYGNDRERFEQEQRKVFDEQLDELVERRLIIHEFENTGYKTNLLEAFIDDQIQKNIQRLYYGDRAKFIKTMEEQGKTFEMYRRGIRDDFIVHYMEYQNLEEPRKTLISPLKIEDYFKTHQDSFKVGDQVKLRMIVLPEPADGPSADVIKTAQEILAKLDSGVAFDEMARIYSSGTKRSEGGEYGWMSRSELKQELADVAFALKSGQHSRVIECPEACYLLLVEDIRAAHVQSLAEIRGEIERTLRTVEQNRLRKQWIERLKKKSFIQYYR